MAVVVTRRYAYVERIAGFRWGRKLGAFVPAMLSRDVSRGGTEADDADAPTDEAVADANEVDAEEGTAPDEDAVDETDAPVAAAPTKRAPKQAAREV